MYHPQPLLYVFDYTSTFFSFVGQFDFGCSSLVQDISSVIYYLLCFGWWLVAFLLSAFTAFPVFIY
jgi:hypothetical protein